MEKSSFQISYHHQSLNDFKFTNKCLLQYFMNKSIIFKFIEKQCAAIKKQVPIEKTNKIEIILKDKRSSYLCNLLFEKDACKLKAY